MEHIVAAHPNLPRALLFADFLAVFADQLNLNTGQGQTDMARSALAFVRIRDSHPDFCHAVALEKYLTGEFLPLFEQLNGAGGGAGNIQTHLLKSRTDFFNRVFFKRVEILD